jgi:hypothetical protein
VLRTACPVSGVRSAIRLHSTKPRSQITAIAPHRASPRHPEVPLLSRGRFPAPAPPCPVCIPLASTFQRQLAAHVSRTGVCVVFLPAIGAFQRHSTRHPLHYWSPSGFNLLLKLLPSGFRLSRLCSTHWVWRFRLS